MPPSLKDKLDATRRAHILSAAAEAFAERGFHATTIKEIAHRAGVADGTIYNAFDDKEALLLSIFDQLQHEMPAPALPSDLREVDLRELLRLFLGAALSGLDAHEFRLFRVVTSEILVNPELGERYRAELLAPMLDGAASLLRAWSAAHATTLPHLDLTLRAVAALVLGLAMQRALGDEALAESWSQLPDTVAEMLAGGIGGADQQPGDASTASGPNP